MTGMREKRIIVLAGLYLLITCASLFGDTDVRRIFTYDEIPPLGQELEQAFVGRSGGDLLVMGGFKIGEAQRQANTSVYVLPATENTWRELPALDVHVYGGAAVSSDKGVICLGGYENDRLTKQVVRYALKDNTLVMTPLNDLPVLMPTLKAAIFSN